MFLQLHVSALFLGHRQAKQIQPDDGLRKGPKHVVV